MTPIGPRRVAPWLAARPLGLALCLCCLALACHDTEPRSTPARTVPSRASGARAAPLQAATSSRAPAVASAAAPEGLVASLPSVFGKALVFDDGPWRCIAINSKSSIQSCRHRSRPLDFRYEYVQLLLTGALAQASPTPKAPPTSPAPPASPASKTSQAPEAPSRGVLLGLGGAGIVHLLRATRPALKLDIVEIDGAVVALARQHFGYLARPGEQAFVQDAARFAKRPEQAGRHDLVMVDCFGESFIPPALLTAEFFRDVRGLLSPRGVLVANLWSTHPRHEAIVRQYGKFYPHIWLVPGRSSGNSILVASPNPLPDQATMIKRAHDLDSRSLVPFKVLPHAMRMRRP